MSKSTQMLSRLVGIGILLIISNYCISQELYQDRTNRFIDSLSLQYGDSVEIKIWDHLLTEYAEFMKGAQLSNYLLINLNGDTIDIDQIDKPIFFKITASWCRGCLPEISALNELATKYADRMEFIFLTHDQYARAQKSYGEKLAPNIHLIPSSQFMEVMGIVKLSIGGFDHILPFPTTYITDKNHKILSVQTGGAAVGVVPTMDGGTKVITQEEAHQNTLDRFKPLIEHAIEK